MHVAIIGGASTIGTTTAYALASYDPAINISLIDINVDAAWGQAKGIQHSVYHFANSPISDRNVEHSSIQEVSIENADKIDPDLIIITASIPQTERPDSSDNSDQKREGFSQSVPLADEILKQLHQMDPTPVINVTNPVDSITHYFWEKLGWSRNLFIGYTLSETARAADAIAQRFNVHQNQVHCPTMGQHGPHVVPIFSQTTIDGEIINVPEEERGGITEYIQNIAFEMLEKRGGGSSRWVTGSGLARLARVILYEEASSPLCVATPLQGEYGFESGCMSVPATLGPEGVEEIVEWNLTNDEERQLIEAHQAIQKDRK